MRRVRKRDEEQPIPYSTEAIICGDSKDPTGANMTDVFNGIIFTSHNISAMCEYPGPCTRMSNEDAQDLCSRCCMAIRNLLLSLLADPRY